MSASPPFDDYESLMFEFPTSGVQDILSHGCGANQADSGGNFLLTIACRRLQVDNVLLLLSLGADTEVRESEGDTALICVIDVSHHNPAAALAIAEALIAGGANLEARGYMDKTPFLKTCSRGCLAILQLLVSRGCDVGARDADGNSGEDLARIFHGSREFQDYVRGLHP
jgi:ankyrin repeat protein